MLIFMFTWIITILFTGMACYASFKAGRGDMKQEIRLALLQDSKDYLDKSRSYLPNNTDVAQFYLRLSEIMELSVDRVNSIEP